MTRILTIVQIAFFCSNFAICFAFGQPEATPTVRVKGDQSKAYYSELTPYSMFFDPLLNGVRLDRQRIDYDLTKETILRIGPYIFDESSVTMHMTRETGEFYELDFGFEVTRKIGPVYVMSFRWPADYVTKGVIEIINDKAESLWRRTVTENDYQEWKLILESQNNKELFERKRSEYEAELFKDKTEKGVEAVKERLGLARPRNLSRIHQKTQFGLAHKGFFEVPIAQIQEPFRYCVTDDQPGSRVALCSRPFQFVREAGRYRLISAPRNSTARVLVNDKPVTLKGSAIFLQNDIPIKFAAVLKNGTYFEFVSHPKEIRLVDMTLDRERNRVIVVGYGDAPMAQIEASFYADPVHTQLLNFMPTIGDLRKFWVTTVSPDAPYLYLRGEGGAPFRQNIFFEELPDQKLRPKVSELTTKAFYSDKFWVEGQAPENVTVSAEDTEVESQSGGTFRWYYPAPQAGEYNRSYVTVDDGDKKWKAYYEMFRGRPAEISARLTGVVSSELQLILLGEIAGQYWFERLLGLDSYRFSKLRWGVAARHFQSLASQGGNDEAVKDIEIAVTNVDLKYRLTPGIWGRDPTVGLIAAVQNVKYDVFEAPMAGGGVFWARSMPKIFDDFFNLIPIFRYPKWVDWEFIYYPLSLDPNRELQLNTVMNFHGKIQWTPQFFGEGGFGVKTFSFSDLEARKRPSLGIAYGTIGVGYNF